MEKINKLILLGVHMSVCNFRCSYCYLSQRDESFQNQQVTYKYSPEHVAKALSKERLGGTSYINICADGETLLAKDITKYTYEILKEGHYVEFVSNLTITKVLEEMLSWDKELLKRLEFKCSLHYIELKKRNLLDTFAQNVQKIWDAGSSANIEITPHDELIPYLDDVKEYSMKNFGALPHITIARRDDTDGIEYLTELSVEKYDEIWASFDSDFWKFKKTIFMQKRNEFCHAGKWSLAVDIANGNSYQCYVGQYKQNIFENLNKPIDFTPIGRCFLSHCYNGHMLLTLGCIDNFTDVKYGDIRDRVKPDGTKWLQPELKEFFNTRLFESNSVADAQTQKKIMRNSVLFDKTLKLVKKAKKIKSTIRK